MDRPRFTTLLAVATMGVYALLVLGATTAITDAAGACPTWPACEGQWFAVDSLDLAVVWGHRATALAVGLLAAWLAVAAWRRGESRRIRAALTAAVALYPVQVGIGAVTATTGTPALVSGVHLVLGLTIFGGLVLALAWALEPADAPEPADVRQDPTTPAPVETDEAADLPTDDDGATGPVAVLQAYFRLTKPRLMWLLCLVASAGMALAAGPDLGVRTVVATLAGGVLAIGASGTFNHVLERDVDELMSRTADRPIVRHRIPVRNAVAFGVALAAASVAVFLTINPLAAGLGLAAILYYSVVYTLVLKPNTVQNIVVGGFAGAFPALIGWAAVTGALGVPALALAGVIFLWTPAHFYNLALAYKADYARGGFPMLPVVRGDAVTRKHVLLYLGATLAGATLLARVSSLGSAFAATSVLFGGGFLWAVLRLHRERTTGAAFRAFHASNAYLGALLLTVVVDALAI